MRTADVVFTSSALTADDIATFDNAVGILCYSVGMDYVDAKAAAAKGIPIWNCPTSNNEEVSDHGVLLVLAAQRRLVPFATAAAQGDWEIYKWPLYQELHRIRSRTIGIIGLGRIGHLIAQKLMGFRPRSSRTTRTSRRAASPRWSWCRSMSCVPGRTSSCRPRR